MTEQNYINGSSSTTASVDLIRQLSLALEQIAELEQRVNDLQEQLALMQGGTAPTS